MAYTFLEELQNESRKKFNEVFNYCIRKIFIDRHFIDRYCLSKKKC